MKTHEHWWHMFCEYVYLTTKPEGVNLENDEITKYGLCWWLHIFWTRWLVLVNLWKLTQGIWIFKNLAVSCHFY